MVFKVLLSFYLWILFFIISFFVAFLQFLSLPLFYTKWKNEQRKFVGMLSSLQFSVAFAGSQIKNQVKIDLVTDEETLNCIKSEGGLFVMNHRSQVEFVALFLLSKYLGVFTNSKGVYKEFLRKVPIIGWTMRFLEYLSVKRNFLEDKSSIRKSLKNYSMFDFPVNVILFSEGTRFTPQKHKASLEFGEKNGLKPTKNVLLPRPKGFHLIANEMKQFSSWLYDVVLYFDETKGTTISDFICMKPIHGFMMIRKIRISEVPSDEAGSGKFLRNLFYSKDELIEYCKNNKSFPCSGEQKVFSINSLLDKKKFFMIPLAWTILMIFILYIFLTMVGTSFATLIFKITLTILLVGVATIYLSFNSYSNYGKK